MAKANKVNNDSNFEKLKEKLLQKRDIARDIAGRRFEPDPVLDPVEQESGPQKKTPGYSDINIDNNINVDRDVNTDSSINIDIDANRNASIAASGNRDIYGNTNVYGNTSVDNNINGNIGRNSDGNISGNINVSVNRNTEGNNYGNISGAAPFILKVGKKENALKRQSYYLKESTIGIIDDISASSGIGKSELVQRILEEALKNIRIVSG